MNQPDSLNVQSSAEVNASQEPNADALEAKTTAREWLPEDDDDWYEPDYRRAERAS